MSFGEMIELKELTMLDDRIELTAPAPSRTTRLERVNALRISPGKVHELLNRVRIIRLLGDSMNDPRLVEDTGEGHNFQPCSHTQPTWCDLCGDFIWGLYRQSLRCTNCRFTCHYRCRALIKLDCNQDRGSLTDQSDDGQSSIETDTNVLKSTYDENYRRVDRQVEELAKEEILEVCKEDNDCVKRLCCQPKTTK